MYSLRNLVNVANTATPDKHYQVLQDGVTPVAILTNKYSDFKIGAQSRWRVILLKDNDVCDLFGNQLLTAQEALNILNKNMEGDSIKGPYKDPECLLRYVTAFGMHLFRAMDPHSVWDYYSVDKLDGTTFPKAEAKQRLNVKELVADLPLQGDQVVEIQVIVKHTNEVIASKQLKLEKQPTVFSDAPDLWPTEPKA